MQKYKNFLQDLESGLLRAANFDTDNNSWTVNQDVKIKILEIFKNTKIVQWQEDNYFSDKELLFPQQKTTPEDFNLGIRVVPGGSSIRAGAHIGKQVIVMPPSYINIGAYIGDLSMVDSQVLVGSCAQIGNRVHLSAGVVIGGVLEPVGQMPVIVEDDAFIGANSSLVEGIIVKKNAVIGSGVQLTASTPIYDLVNERQLPNGIIPENAIVLSGTRPITKNIFASSLGLGLSCAIIIKYRNSSTSTNAKLELETALRGL